MIINRLVGMIPMLKNPLLVLISAALVACGESAEYSPEPAGSQPAPELIPFKKLFAPTRYAAPKVSPDGKWLSWIAPVAGVNNFFVAPIDDLKNPRQLTFKTEQGIRPADVSGVVMYKWSADSRYLIYPHDYQGDENWDIWVVDVDKGTERNLTPSPDKSWLMLGLSNSTPSEIVASAGTFGKQDKIFYSLNLDSGETREIVDTAGRFYGLITGHDYQPLVGIQLTDNRGVDLYRYREGDWQLMTQVLPEDVGALSAAGYQKITRVSADNRYLYTYSSVDRDTNALVAYDLETGELLPVAADSRVDLFGVLYHPQTNKPLAYAVNWDRVSWRALDESVAADLKTVGDRFSDGDFMIVSQSQDQRYWVLRYLFPDAPYTYQLWDRRNRTMTELGVSSPELLEMELSRVYPTIMDSSDGLPLISYYSLPIGADADGDGIPEQPVPLVMLVHGGPSDERANYGFGNFAQWLNSRGYAVYNMNYRGSAGFGKTYLNAANGEWGGKMHRDLLEQLDYVVEQGIADPNKVAILGGSYGGYATLVGMTMTPEVFACGVDLVGPSNLEIPMPHWRPESMAVFLGGDPRTEEGRAHLRAISPVTHAHKTRGAVLIGQGTNDSRVPQDQSDQIVDIMQKAGAKVVYAVYGDEGHGFRRPENNASFWGVAEIFLGQCLGGRYEALGDKLEGSSVEFPAGAEHIPGLEEALVRRQHKIK